jgi:preprotein translocase subunit Sec63
MASMAFDTVSVSLLMNLVDDHKDEIKEADYIKICNALKVLQHNLANDSVGEYSHPYSAFGTSYLPVVGAH